MNPKPENLDMDNVSETPPDFNGVVGSILARSTTRQTWSSQNIGGTSDTALATYLAATVLCGVKKAEGNFYVYTGTQWEVIPYSEMHQAVQALDGKECLGSEKSKKPPPRLAMNETKIQGVLKVLSQRRELADADFFRNAAKGINSAGGFIRFDRDGNPERVDHAPEHAQRYTLPGSWPNGHGTGHLIREALRVNFLDEDDCEQKIDLLGEVAGVALLGLGGQKRSQCVVMWGEVGDNGKSTIINLMLNGMPTGSHCSLPPSKWSDDRHLVLMVGKSFNAVAELGTASVIGSEEFKKAITGDEFTARDVYRSAFNFRPGAMHLFATNDMPAFAGGLGPAIRKRILILRCDRTIPLDERDESVEWLPISEPDAWLAFVVDGASRYLRQGRFTCPPSSEEAMASWSQSADPVLAWIDCRLAPMHAVEDRCKSTTIWADFELFCRAELQMRQRNIPQQRSFFLRLESELKRRRSPIKRSQDNNFRGFYNMRLLPETEDMEILANRPIGDHSSRPDNSWKR